MGGILKCSGFSPKDYSQDLCPFIGSFFIIWCMKCTSSTMTTLWGMKVIPEEYLEHVIRILEWPLFPQATCLIQCGNTIWIVLSTVPRGSHSNKSVDDLMLDEKRQHPFFFFTIPHGIYFRSTLIILWSIKACSKSRCILPQADSTCKHFLSRTPLPRPEAKHDYPILMRFLMCFFYPCKTIQLSPMYILRLMFAVWWYAERTYVDVLASHAPFFLIVYRPEFYFTRFMFAWC